MMKTIKYQIPNIRLIMSLSLIIVAALLLGCQKVDKPVRGEEGSSPMAIVIDGDAPDSHLESMTSEGRKLVNPYSEIPVIGPLFKTDLTGLDFWKAYHPLFVTGPHNPGLKTDNPDEEENCLDCHDQNTSCNNCHSYVGAKLITGGE